MNDPKSSNNHLPPSEEQLAGLLKSFRPHPSNEFHNRMESAPWHKDHPAYTRSSNIIQWLMGIYQDTPLQSWRIVMASSTLLIVIIVLTLAFPSLQALAQQFLHFFIPAPTDELALQVTISPTGTQEALNAEGRYPLTLDEAQKLAGYPLDIPTQLPEGVSLTGANYNPDLEIVTLRYLGPGYTLLFNQRVHGQISEYSTVGASAPVETVLLNGIPGEFVVGGWRLEDSNDRINTTATSSTQVSLGVFWDPTLPQFILRWQVGEMQYEILCIQTGPAEMITKNELINLAESIDSANKR